MDHLDGCKTSFRFLLHRVFHGFWFSSSNLFHAGGAGGTDETGTNKDTHQLPVISMRTLIDVPASFSCQSLQWDVANPRTTMLFHLKFPIYCTVVAIWNYFRSNMYGSASSEPSSEQGRRKLTSH